MAQDGTIEALETFLFTKKIPVSFETFCESPEFCNNPSIFEFWKRELGKLPLSLSELIVDGSLGGGKSMTTAIWMAYRVYCLFLNGDPRARLDLAPDSPLYILYFSVSLKMAKKSGFQYLYNVIKSCKWFQNNMPLDENLTSSISFPNNVSIDYASAEGHQIGLNVWGFILDEANFKSGIGEGLVSDYEAVTQLYSQLLDRLVSRFSREDGSVDALAILVSSASYQSSFVEKRKEAIANDDNAACITAVTYLIRPEKYSKITFDVFQGTSIMDPCVVQDEAHKLRIIKQLKVENTGMEDNFFKKVPMNLIKAFNTNVALALQNFCGVATQIKGRFMRNMKPLNQAYYECTSPWFSQDQVSISNGDAVELMDYIIRENIEYPDRPHSFFLDLSVSGDSGGFSCVRYDGMENNSRMHTHVFSLEVIPPPYPNETRIKKFHNFFLEIAEIVNVVAVGTDQYQSKALRQDILADLGLTDTRLSIDSSDEFHLHWVRALVEKTLRMIFHKKLHTEVEEAEHDMRRRRVVKKKDSTDDMFQSIVGAFFLSDTVGAADETNLEVPKSNVIGQASVRRVLKRLGYR